MPVSTDTIVAISTPAGRGGLGVVRLSGPEALSIGQALTGVAAFRPRHAHFAHFRDAEGAVLDEVVATAFPAPRSATAEDVVEITAHGSPVLLAALVAAAQARGARLAEPGEFTRRAFLNGRIDLTQAEAVRDLIDAHTLFQARTAARQMQGSVASALRPLHRRYTELIAHLEAGIDFADDDVTVAANAWIGAEIAAVGAAVEQLLSSFQRGRTVREGVSVAIVGRPNVGKSSLFNRLLASDRAIVTAEAGTTRDLVAEPMDWEGVPVRLVDTAGLRDPKGEAERLGIQKSWEAAADAHLVLAVFDRSQPLTADDHALLRQVKDWPLVVLVGNKSDLPVAATCQRHEQSGPPLPPVEARPQATSGSDPAKRGEPPTPGDTSEPLLPVSARTGEGLAELRAAVRHLVAPDVSEGAEFITNARHAQQLASAATHLQQAGAAAAAGLPHEVLLVDLYDGLHALDAITGQTTVEDILGVIFSTFCIGK